MANGRVKQLFVLTLLQLCRAQTFNNISESWYLANMINDESQPQSNTELFSKESSFSTANPIVVLEKSTAKPEKIFSSTLQPSLFQDTRSSPLPPSTSLSPTWSTATRKIEVSSRIPSQSFQVDVNQFTEHTKAPLRLLPENQPDLQQTTRAAYTSTSEPQLALFDSTVPQQIHSSRSPVLTTSIRPTSNRPQLQFSSTQTFQRPMTKAPILQSTRIGEISRFPTTMPLSEKRPTRNPATNFLNTTPKNDNTTRFSNLGLVPLKIRVVSPRGSITNVHINPHVYVTPTTTTNRPTTNKIRKTPKQMRNTYETCLSGCKVTRKPICAIPLSATSIDPENLKGFPSVCHMACFNSFRKKPYEKLVDGRCGRLRTRIHTFDSNTKLKRKELNKAQYTLDGGDQVSVQLSSLCD